ncbi:MAG: site-specific integrase [Steroidobacteraceae bacterium]
MPRQPRNSRLQTRAARAKLKPQHEPYWHEVQPGLHLGYRKGAKSGKWYLREFRAGRRWKRRLGLADDSLPADGAAVLSWKQAIKIAVGDQRPTATATDAYTVGDALEAYWVSRMARSTIGSVETDQAKAAASIMPRWAAHDVNKLESAELRRWFSALIPETADPEIKRRAQATANRTWAVFRAALNQAFGDGKATSDLAWRRIRPYRNVDRARTRNLTSAEARRALNAMPPDFRSLARGALNTGMRLGELLALRVSDVDAAKVTVRHSKSGKARTIPLSEEGEQFFAQVTAGKAGDELVFTRADGQKWYSMEVSRQMARVSKNAKLEPPVRFHDLRRSYASLLINAGTDAEIIRDLLGHADLRMTTRAYAHLRDRTLAKAVERNLPSFGLEDQNVRKLHP